MSDTFWIDLVAIILLVLLGYGGGRLAERFGLPAVTAFLLVGIAFGPYGLRLLTAEVMSQVSFVEPMALGLIVFLVGEELTPRGLLSRPWYFWVTAALAVVLPFALVGGGAYLLTGDVRVALLLAIIGLSGAPATVMAVVHEAQRRGVACDILLGTSALDNVVTVVLYAVTVPFLVAGAGIAIQGVALSILQSIGAAVVVGVAAGFIMAKLLERVTDTGQMLTLGLLGVALVVALDEVLHSSVILAALAAGITVAVMEESKGVRGRLFNVMSTVKYGVYIIFFTLAGAALQPSLALSAGALALVYIVMRSAGRIGAGMIGGAVGGLGRRASYLLGLGMLPQAGVAVGLALDAGVTFPIIGPTVNAVVLAAIVVFELVGPLAVRRAVTELGEPVDEGDEVEPALVCHERTVAVAVKAGADGRDVLRSLEAAHLTDAGCPLKVALVHVARPRRNEGSELGEPESASVLAAVARAVNDAGHMADEVVVRNANVERGIAQAVADSGATVLVVPVSGGQRGFLARRGLKSRRHRIVDAVDVPTFVVDPDTAPEAPALEVGEAVDASDETS